jgi:L-threonylcarbamoyladenylate synthase
MVAFPTETVYGLGGDALNPDAVARVFAAKGRPAENPMIVHVSGGAMARLVVAEWPGVAEQLGERFWPGPLTLVLPKADRVPPAVTAGGPTVAVRVPDHPLALALIEAFGGPIVGPSANPAGYISPTCAEHVRRHFDEAAVLVLDGGPCRAGIESTVLDLTRTPPAILRRGVVDPGALAEILGQSPTPPDAHGAAAGEGGAVASPGVIGAHYQPRAPVVLVTDIADLGRLIAECGGKVVLLSPPGRPVRVSPPHESVAMPGLASGYARKLYSAMREADEADPDRIIVVMPALTDSPIWEAVRDRLRRASGG